MRRTLTPELAAIPAAQYVRMSDEGQQYSIENQKCAIQKWAGDHGFEIVRTYADCGRSGVVMSRRTALRQLLQDVRDSSINYRAILVYDVSRWGRFQNNDEAAYYEFLCTSSGIPLHYCAEQFANDQSPSSAILKALKRSMAAEYSRELSVKVFEGKSRLVRLGFWVGGPAGYGLRRMMLSHDGKPRQELKTGEHKCITTDRIILVPGIREEIDCVRQIFNMVLQDRKGCTAIARELNSKGIRYEGRPWSHTTVFNLLTNPKYTGCNVWNRSSQRLRGRRTKVSKEKWITKPGAFVPLIDQATFDRAQVVLPRKADQLWSDHELLKKLKHLLVQKGRLSDSLIQQARGMPSTATLHNHFGSYRQMYKLAGYDCPPEDLFKGEQCEKTLRLRRQLIEKIRVMFPTNVVVCHLPNRSRSILRLDDEFFVSVLLCRTRRRSGKTLWVVTPNLAERQFITLVCTLNPAHDRFVGMFVFRSMDMKSHYSYSRDPWLASGSRLTSLSRFYATVKEAQRVPQLSEAV